MSTESRDDAAVAHESAAVAEALAALARRRPEAADGLDARAVARLKTVVSDPGGQTWMEAAGLLGSDSCGYPVAGGYQDVRGDLGALPIVAQRPEVGDRVMERLIQEWADDYVLTGEARLDRPWRSYVDQFVP
ncbi:MAG: hypothetical protein WCF04_15440 [Candidatus Nanopelagicales bacterium]